MYGVDKLHRESGTNMYAFFFLGRRQSRASPEVLVSLAVAEVAVVLRSVVARQKCSWFLRPLAVLCLVSFDTRVVGVVVSVDTAESKINRKGCTG